MQSLEVKGKPLFYVLAPNLLVLIETQYGKAKNSFPARLYSTNRLCSFKVASSSFNKPKQNLENIPEVFVLKRCQGKRFISRKTLQ